LPRLGGGGKVLGNLGNVATSWRKCCDWQLLRNYGVVAEEFEPCENLSGGNEFGREQHHRNERGETQ
jgi:hypothetical protein